MRLQKKTAIITGASSGLGRAMALRFAAEGAFVVIADITQQVREGGEATLKQIEDAGGRGAFLTCDVSNPQQIERVVAETADRHGRLDIMVNNAMTGKFEPKPLLECSDAQWRETLAVNLDGVFYGCRAAVRQMAAQDIVNEVRGRIINFSSQLGIRAAPNNCAYGVTKAGIDYLTRSIARDYADKQIVCNAIAPGKMLTGKTGQSILPEVLEFSQSRTPWPRLGKPQDIANAALFLASDEATFIQGETLAVDGGWLAS